MLIAYNDEGKRLDLNSATAMTKASAFLWNKRMMIHMNCRGFAVAQFMQPEPAKYAHAPNLEAKTFMQPEQPYYAHHTGRFCYIKESGKELFSIPYEPVKNPLDQFNFSIGESDILWKIKKNDLEIEMKLTLTRNDLVELWSIRLTNKSDQAKKLDIYPYFPVGYMSWMNQSAVYDDDLKGIVCTSISPYQKYQDYDKVRHYKDKTFLIANRTPFSYEANQEAFEGEGGLNNPAALQNETLLKGDARYETPVCALQYKIDLQAGHTEEFRFVFGPAKDEQEIKEVKKKYFDNPDGFEGSRSDYLNYIKEGRGCLKISTPNKKLDHFVNQWLPRQVYYHGETNRLSTDPQTRNYLQDNMGMAYIKPNITRQAFKTALEQQEFSGAMPDGILIEAGAELKYINQVPHTDHCVWLPVCLKAYLDETDDYDFLDERIGFSDSNKKETVRGHIHKAMAWLLTSRDDRGLNYINQGDWCDPMNMVGYKGRGVSGWLSLATSYALQVWAEICYKINEDQRAEEFISAANDLNDSVNKYLWDTNWYARGITDDNVVFGVKKDLEGSIFLNPQAWALLSKAADPFQKEKIIAAVERELETPFGVEMLSPAFTSMREDVGRVTQKHPGSAENGSVYNHAAAFYIFGLYMSGEKEIAYRLLDKMIPGPDESDLLQRGQLPIFIPNYYRGAYKQFPRTAGRSSQLFNTGTVHWVYRFLIDGLFGLKGTREGLCIDPQLPEAWKEVKLTRLFRGSEFKVEILRKAGIGKTEVKVDGVLLKGSVIKNIHSGKNYEVKVVIPK
jgi:cellobionic acid phosphorylase